MARTLSSAPGPLILLLTEPDPGLAGALVKRGHFVLQAYDERLVGRGEARALARPSREGIAAALHAAGIAEPRARALARDSARSSVDWTRSSAAWTSRASQSAKRRSLGMSSRSASSSRAVEGMAGPVAERVEMPRRTPVGAAYSTSIRKNFSWNKAARAASYAGSTMT